MAARRTRALLALALAGLLACAAALGATGGSTASAGEGVGVRDTVTAVAGVTITDSEHVGVADSAGRVRGATATDAERIGVGDGDGHLLGALATANEGVGVADNAASHVENTPPRIPGLIPEHVDEGARLLLTQSFVDPDQETWTATVDYGDGGGVQPLPLDPQTKTFTLVHVYDDDGSFTITVVVTDSHNASATGKIPVTVANVAPTADVANDGPVPEGSPSTITLSKALDPSTADTKAGFTFAFACDGAHYGASSSSPGAQCTFDDGPSTRTVLAKISDKDGGSTEYRTDVEVTNVAPAADVSNDGPVDEGSAATISFAHQHDPSQADTAAGFTYEVACDGTTYAKTTGPSAQCTFDDGPSTQTVLASITDKDGGATEYTTHVTVRNVAPDGALTAPQTVSEGASFAVSVGGAHDPSAADAAAGFSYSFACDGSTYSAATKTPNTSCTFDDGPSTHIVRAQITDKDGGVRTLEASVDVTNTAPTATPQGPAAVDEGSPFTLSLGSPSDPSTADTAAGFQYAFDCGDGAGLSPWSSTPSATCPTTDSGTRTTVAATRDKDGGITTYPGAVAVRNVAPTATFRGPPAPPTEGTTFVVSLDRVFDPSSADTTAGFQYAFDCGAGYGPPTTTSSATCPAVDNPGVTVKGKVIDKDGGSTEYTTTAPVTNAAPATTIGAPADGSAQAIGAATAFAAAFTDPGVLDTHTCAVTWDDGSTTPGAVAESGGNGTCTATHTFAAQGSYTIGVTVTDKDGGAGSAKTLLAVFDTATSTFVTGGGWVQTPTGRATFSANARYQHGAASGHVDFSAPGIALASTSYDWFVVSGSTAQWRGAATVNGAAGDSFLFTAHAGPGAFRIEVWDPSGAVVYDNVPGAPDDLDAASPQPLGGGNVQFHK